MKNFEDESGVWSQNFNPESKIERNSTTAEASGSSEDSQHQDLAVLMVNSRDRVGRPKPEGRIFNTIRPNNKVGNNHKAELTKYLQYSLSLLKIDYFVQRLDAVHSKCWSKYSFLKQQ